MASAVEVPARVTSRLFPQTVWLVPAETIGTSEIINAMLSDEEAHVPKGKVVKVSVTLPVVVSASLGVYMAVVELLSSKVPVPVVVHTADAARVKLADIVASLLFPQTVWLGPASTTGAGVNVTIIVLGSENAEQLAVPLTVHVKVTVPAVVSASLGS